MYMFVNEGALTLAAKQWALLKNQPSQGCCDDQVALANVAVYLAKRLPVHLGPAGTWHQSRADLVYPAVVWDLTRRTVCFRQRASRRVDRWLSKERNGTGGTVRCGRTRRAWRICVALDHLAAVAWKAAAA